MKVVSTDEPPYAMSGSGIRSPGMIPMVIPMFRKIWNMNIARIDPAISVPIEVLGHRHDP